MSIPKNFDAECAAAYVFNLVVQNIVERSTHFVFIILTVGSKLDTKSLTLIESLKKAGALKAASLNNILCYYGFDEVTHR